MSTAIGAQSGCEHSTKKSHRIMKNTAYCFRGCKCQYKNVGFLENKSVGFPTSLFSIFLVIFRHILHLIL